MQRGDLRARRERRTARRLWRAPRSAAGALPSRFLGVWERTELVVDGAPVDPGRAVWLEAGSAHVDVRTGHGPDCPSGSGGTTSWDGKSLAWSLDVDSRADGGPYRSIERGRIAFDGDDLLEEGTGRDGSPAPYRARWRRQPGVGGRWAPNLVAETAGGLAVRIGMHTAVVLDRGPAAGGVAATYCRWDGMVWRTELTIRDDPWGLPLLEPGALLPAAWHWRPTPTLP
jgi:hypothetical protein